MKKLNRIPKVGSIIRYIGGETSPNCYLVEGNLYEVIGVDRDEHGEYAWVKMEEELDTVWYIKGSNDFDKYELVEEYLDREDLIELNELKDERIKELESTLNEILNNVDKLLHVEGEEVIKMKRLVENALIKKNLT